MKNKKVIIICSVVLVVLIFCGIVTPKIAEALLFPEIPQTKSTKFANFKKNSAKWQKICEFLGDKNVKSVEKFY